MSFENWNKFVDEVKNNKSDMSFNLRRGENTKAVINEVSNYIIKLQLTTDQNDCLVEKLVRLVNSAEKEQFEEGVKVGAGITKEFSSGTFSNRKKE